MIGNSNGIAVLIAVDAGLIRRTTGDVVLLCFREQSFRANFEFG
jgi:hypothetical protein